MFPAMLLRAGCVAACLLALTACERRKAPGADMAKAESWGGGNAAGDPHAGMDVANPHAGMDVANPHAGMDVANPHGGMDLAHPHGGAQMGGASPDPHRTIDPTKVLKGTLQVTDATRDRVPAGAVLFLYARAASATGEPIGPPLVVQKLPVGTFPSEFSLTEADQMIDGTQFSGAVVVIAHVDQDGDVSTWQPGDLSGRIAATVPTDGLVVVLDTVH
jgi:hypothetical protein